MKKNILLVIVALVACVASMSAQGRKGLCINEVMVQNDSSVVDDYGLRHGWIELYNSTHAAMEISSVYLTNDKNNPTLYPVPLGDVNTEIPALQHVLFWADAEPNKGTFHISFKIKPGETIYIFDADKETIIDQVTIPSNLAANTSYARKADGKGGMDAEAWEVRDGGDKYITPNSNNIIVDTNTKVESFRTLDANGFVLTLMAMSIVFGALLILSVCFYIISKIGGLVSKINKIKAHGGEPTMVTKDETADSGEEIAAIVMALHEHLNAHDQENTILTINKVKKAYSPWSSKIYGLRELPRR